MPKKIILKGTFQCKKGDFGFVIPENRSDWGGDFFVHKNNFLGAIDGQKVKAQVLDRVSGKKPEAKIIEIYGVKKAKDTKKYEVIKTIEGIYSGGSGDFGFVDVEGEQAGYFVYGLKKNGANEGDRVAADVKMFNGKQEAVITKVLASGGEVVQGIYSDNGNFGFVKTTDVNEDIFIPGSKKLDAQDGDKVSVKIIKTSGRRKEGLIQKILSA